jgi:hypothetical protein
VLDPTRHDEEFAGLERDDAITELDVRRASNDEEQFVLSLVVMPHSTPLTMKNCGPPPYVRQTGVVGTSKASLAG